LKALDDDDNLNFVEMYDALRRMVIWPREQLLRRSADLATEREHQRRPRAGLWRRMSATATSSSV
jgi:hypothetical protein